MSTTVELLKEWFDRGKAKKADYMIVVCDTFSHEDYPVFVSRENFWEKHDSYSYGKNMQIVMGIYNLNDDKTFQLGRSPYCDPGPPRT